MTHKYPMRNHGAISVHQNNPSECIILVIHKMTSSDLPALRNSLSEVVFIDTPKPKTQNPMSHDLWLRSDMRHDLGLHMT
jgi:hypothetical protein